MTLIREGVIFMESIRSTKLIELSDEILIEVEVPVTEAKQIASTSADRVGKAIGLIKPLLTKVAHPVYEAIEEIQTTMHVENAEVEINLGFTAEGNVYITKLQSNSSLKVKLTLKPKV
jgi:Trypsin-co-occurring domain 1